MFRPPVPTLGEHTVHLLARLRSNLTVEAQGVHHVVYITVDDDHLALPFTPSTPDSPKSKYTGTGSVPTMHSLGRMVLHPTVGLLVQVYGDSRSPQPNDIDGVVITPTGILKMKPILEDGWKQDPASTASLSAFLYTGAVTQICYAGAIVNEEWDGHNASRRALTTIPVNHRPIQDVDVLRLCEVGGNPRLCRIIITAAGDMHLVLARVHRRAATGARQNVWVSLDGLCVLRGPFKEVVLDVEGGSTLSIHSTSSIGVS